MFLYLIRLTEIQCAGERKSVDTSEALQPAHTAAFGRKTDMKHTGATYWLSYGTAR